MAHFAWIATRMHMSAVPFVIVALGFAPIERFGRPTIPAHSYVHVVCANMMSLHDVIKSMAYKWAPAWEDILSGEWQVWQARPYVDMSTVTEPLAFMTFPGAICITEPGRMHAPLLPVSGDVSPGYAVARDAAITRLPSPAHLPPDAELLSLYLYKDGPVRLQMLKISVHSLTMQIDFVWCLRPSTNTSSHERPSSLFQTPLSVGWFRHSRGCTDVWYDCCSAPIGRRHICHRIAA
jgi:hypothetical protein